MVVICCWLFVVGYLLVVEVNTHVVCNKLVTNDGGPWCFILAQAPGQSNHLENFEGFGHRAALHGG